MSFPRFYPILDTAILESRGLPLAEAARILTAAGARILQLRHKGPYTRVLFDQARAVAEICRSAGTQLIVNDRADIALLLDAGLHIGQDDLSAADARRIIGPMRPLGLSTHTAEQFRTAMLEPADYLAFGPIFPTASKHDPDPVVGLGELSRLALSTTRPVVAIGGITRDRAPDVLAAGIASLAVIGDLYPAPLNPSTLANRAAAWLECVKV